MEIALIFVIWLTLMIGYISGAWKTLEKAGLPGWGILVPIYSHYLLLKLVDRPWWWMLPILNIVFIVVPFEIAGRFGKGPLFGLGLLFLPFVFYPILGFDDSKYSAQVA